MYQRKIRTFLNGIHLINIMQEKEKKRFFRILIITLIKNNNYHSYERGVFLLRKVVIIVANWSDVLYLIGLEKGLDDDGFEAIVPGKPRKVFANKKISSFTRIPCS